MVLVKVTGQYRPNVMIGRPRIVMVHPGWLLLFPFFKRKYDVKYYFDNVSVYLVGKENQGIYLILLGFISIAMSPYVPSSMANIFTLTSNFLYVGIYYIYFSNCSYYIYFDI